MEVAAPDVPVAAEGVRRGGVACVLATPWLEVGNVSSTSPMLFAAVVDVMEAE